MNRPGTWLRTRDGAVNQSERASGGENQSGTRRATRRVELVGLLEGEEDEKLRRNMEEVETIHARALQARATIMPRDLHP